MNLFFVRRCKWATLICWLTIGYCAECRAQQTAITCCEPIRVTADTWKYNSVNCTSGNRITSATISLFNGKIASNTSGIRPQSSHSSLGSNPQVYTYIFTPAITADQTADFIRGMTFSVTDTGAEVSASVTVDANPTRLPEGSTITAFDHPDGTTHYYVCVIDKQNNWLYAYQQTKTFYFMGMRGYLATITSRKEDELLTNISTAFGWSGGTRIGGCNDKREYSTIEIVNYAWAWACGPEANVIYFTKMTYADGGQEIGYSNWGRKADGNPDNEPNNDGGAEICMQINYISLKWNDLRYESSYDIVPAYFIEFGGTEKTSSGPMSIKYKRPTAPVDNDQWYLYDPANQASSSEVSLSLTPKQIYIMNVK